MQTAEQKCQELAEELMVYVQNTHKDIELLDYLKRLISSQQTQIKVLKQENEQYRKKLSRITDSWYGKILVACYKKFRRLLGK